MSRGKQLTMMQIIKIMSKVDRGWPAGLSLFVNNGKLMLIDEDDNRRIAWTFDDIQADGGDLGSVFDADGFEYLNTKEGGE